MQPDTLAAAQTLDFSLLALFLRASFTVKLVMLLLIVASFWSWTIIIQKHFDLRRAKEEARDFDQAFWSGEPLDTVFDRMGPEPQGGAARIFAAGMTEWRRSHRKDGGLIAGATTARLVLCWVAISSNEPLMPQTVPKRPTKGEIEPTVAR